MTSLGLRQAASPHADNQTYRRYPDLVCRIGFRLRRSQQERSLSDFDARPGEYRSGGGEYRRAHCADPARLLAQTDRRKIAGLAVVRAVAGDVVCAGIVRI